MLKWGHGEGRGTAPAGQYFLGLVGPKERRHDIKKFPNKGEISMVQPLGDEATLFQSAGQSNSLVSCISKPNPSNLGQNHYGIIQVLQVLVVALAICDGWPVAQQIRRVKNRCSFVFRKKKHPSPHL